MARIIREGKLQPQSNSGGITRITVGGFKSIVQEQSIEIKPLTILAGANSSGKSSIMQPLLLLKQTLESTYDPGSLLLNGPNVKFTEVDQLLSHVDNGQPINIFHVGMEVGDQAVVTTYFTREKNKGFDVIETAYKSNGPNYRVYTGMPQNEAQIIANIALRTTHLGSSKLLLDMAKPGERWEVSFVQSRCFLVPALRPEGPEVAEADDIFVSIVASMPGEALVENSIHQTLHLPGLRGSPERDYPVTATGPTFPGTFELYAASIIEHWQLDNAKQKLKKLFSDLTRLALTNKVIARRRNATAIELLVNRFLQGDKEDMVSIADVGIGVSQALPVVVALHTANPGQLVYIEQPEIHLHPRAQYAMAEVLANAAKEGKRLVIETHSSILLLGIQTLVAEGKLPPELVKLHWFTQQEDGSTKIDSADLDERGAYGDWAEDFDDVALYSEGRFLDAQSRTRGQAGE